MLWRCLVLMFLFGSQVNISVSFSDENDLSKSPNGKRRKPLNKYYYQGNRREKSKKIQIPLSEYFKSFRMKQFQEKLEDYLGRTNIYENLTNHLTTFHFMSGFLTQLEKDYIVQSKINDKEKCLESIDHLLIPRLHSRTDDTVIILKYSGDKQLEALEEKVENEFSKMLEKDFRKEIHSNFPNGRKEYKRIRNVYLISLGISYSNVLLRHKQYKLENTFDKFTSKLLDCFSAHDMIQFQTSLDKFIVLTNKQINVANDLKTLVEGFLDQNEQYYSKSNIHESIYIPRNRKRKGKKNIAYVIKYKVGEGILRDEIDDQEQDDAFFESLPTVDTVRTVVLFHRKSYGELTTISKEEK